MSSTMRSRNKSHSLQQLLKKKQPLRDEFPTSDAEDYASKFIEFENFMNKEIHRFVNIGSTTANKGAVLTDHGPDHVRTVIDRASMILGERANKLLGYEIYVLLLSIHFHDVGNAFGREDHEDRVHEIVNKYKDRLSLVPSLARTVGEIASSHGGHVLVGNERSKNTISAKLQEGDHVEGVRIRPQVLASILRFSDEIAEDRTRAARFLVENSTVPPDNLIHHLYAMSIEQPAIEGTDLIYKYGIQLPHAKEPIQISPEDGKPQYLYDEILRRISKTYAELRYCQQYWDELVRIRRIKVAIDVYDGSKRLFHDDFIVGPSYMGFAGLDQRCLESMKAKTGKELADRVGSEVRPSNE